MKILKPTSKITLAMLMSLLVGCMKTTDQSVPSTNAFVTVNEDLYKNLQQSKEEMVKERTPLSLRHGKEVNNCELYLGLSAEDRESAFNKRIAGEYVVCDMLKLIGEKKIVSAGEKSNDFKFGIVLNEKLKLRSIPSSFGPRISSDTTPGMLADSGMKVTPVGVSIDNAQQFFEIQVLGYGDVNDNGLEDWVIRVVDQLHDGNYYSVKGGVILDVKKQEGLLRVSRI